MSRLRIALLGAGNHSLQNHISSFAKYRDEHPDEIELAALCDLRESHANEIAAEYGFGKVYTDLASMIDGAKPDACAAITPIPVTLDISTAIMRAGIPVVVEKPPGDTVEEARQVCDVAGETGTPSMVSMNRRFDPALTAATTWWGNRPLEYLRGTMIRHRRREDEFIKGTAIHALDAMRSVAGDIAEWSLRMRTVDGVRWYFIDITFQTGTHGLLEITPTAGSVAEWYEFYGPDCRAVAHVGDYGPGEVSCWEDNELQLHEASTDETPLFVRNGTYGETTEFIRSVIEKRNPTPSPAQVLQSVEICNAILEEANRR